MRNNTRSLTPSIKNQLDKQSIEQIWEKQKSDIADFSYQYCGSDKFANFDQQNIKTFGVEFMNEFKRNITASGIELKRGSRKIHQNTLAISFVFDCFGVLPDLCKEDLYTIEKKEFESIVESITKRVGVVAVSGMDFYELIAAQSLIKENIEDVFTLEAMVLGFTEKAEKALQADIVGDHTVTRCPALGIIRDLTTIIGEALWQAIEKKSLNDL